MKLISQHSAHADPVPPARATDCTEAANEQNSLQLCTVEDVLARHYGGLAVSNTQPQSGEGAKSWKL